MSVRVFASMLSNRPTAKVVVVTPEMGVASTTPTIATTAIRAAVDASTKRLRMISCSPSSVRIGLEAVRGLGMSVVRVDPDGIQDSLDFSQLLRVRRRVGIRRDDQARAFDIDDPQRRALAGAE